MRRQDIEFSAVIHFILTGLVDYVSKKDFNLDKLKFELSELNQYVITYLIKETK